MSNPYDTAPDKQLSVLGPTLVFKGELSAEEDLLIQGRVEGSIQHNQSLTVGKEGSVKANIKAQYITVEGTVEGDLFGTKAVLVREGGDVRGNIFSPTVSLVEGARFNGSVDMDVDVEKAVASPPAKPRTEPAAAGEPMQATAPAQANSETKGPAVGSTRTKARAAGSK